MIKRSIAPVYLASFLTMAAVSNSFAQDRVEGDSNVSYPAAYFSQYEPLTVNDMLDRVPEIHRSRIRLLTTHVDLLISTVGSLIWVFDTTFQNGK